jgi:hypothetical protein
MPVIKNNRHELFGTNRLLFLVRSPQNSLACLPEPSDESTRRQLTVAKGDYEK